jgi:hypothetical protein
VHWPRTGCADNPTEERVIGPGGIDAARCSCKANASFDTGNDVLRFCTSTSSFDQGTSFGMISGYFDTMRLAYSCPNNPGISRQQVSWALHWLSKGMEFSNFMIFGVLGIAAMVSCGYAWDYLSAGAASDHGHSKTI